LTRNAGSGSDANVAATAAAATVVARVSAYATATATRGSNGQCRGVRTIRASAAICSTCTASTDGDGIRLGDDVDRRFKYASCSTSTDKRIVSASPSTTTSDDEVLHVPTPSNHKVP
jgi:hypothetical protein